MKKFDVFNLINTIPSYQLSKSQKKFNISRLNNEIGAIDENSEIFYGADAFEQVFSKIPIFWPIAIFMKIPFIIYITRYIYKLIAKNRHKLTQEGCEINSKNL